MKKDTIPSQKLKRWNPCLHSAEKKQPHSKDVFVDSAPDFNQLLQKCTLHCSVILLGLRC